MHLLSHFCDHLRQFGNIPMYSTEFGELAHKTQIMAEWRQLNKNDGSLQIVQSYSRQHGIRIRLLNLESLRRWGADLSPNMVEQLDTTNTTTAPDILRRMLKGRVRWESISKSCEITQADNLNRRGRLSRKAH